MLVPMTTNKVTSHLLPPAELPDGAGASLNPFAFVDGAAEFVTFLVEVLGGVEVLEARTPTPDGRLIHAQVNPSGFCEAEIKLALIPYLPKSGCKERSQTEAIKTFGPRNEAKRSENAGESYYRTGFRTHETTAATRSQTKLPISSPDTATQTTGECKKNGVSV